MKNPGIKIPYLDITDKPIVYGTRCVEVKIPDDDAYLPVLAGLMAIASRWFNWQRDDTHKGTQIAKIWNQAYVETDWGSCMNCEELVACLQPVFDLQTADILAATQAMLNAQTISIVNQVTTNITNYQVYQTNTPGQPMTPEQSAENIVGETNPACNKNILWAQCLALVQFTNRAIEDLFDRIESAANAVELAGVFNDLPIVVWISETLGGEFAEGLVNYYQEAVQEGYLSQYDAEYENELACALFCAAGDDCTLSVDLLVSVFYERVDDVVPTTPADTVELLLLAAGITVTGTTVVDLMFWFGWQLVQYSKWFIGDALPSMFTLQNLLNLAVNDANNDWMILCEECPAYVQEFDFSISDGGFVPSTRSSDFSATYLPGVGWLRNSGDDAPDTDIEFEIWHALLSAGDIQRVEVEYELSALGDSINQIRMSEFDTSSSSTPGTEVFNNLTDLVADGVQVFTWNGFFDATADGISLAILNYFVPPMSAVIVTKIRFYGEINPFV